MAVLIGDHLRQMFNIGVWDPTPDEIERYVVEVDDYDRVANLQYRPSNEKIRFILSKIPVEINGEPTEKLDVLSFKDLARIETDAPPYRPPTLYYYHPYCEDQPPPFIIDISDHFDAKLEALRAHESQFHNPNYPGQPTFISSENFWESIRTRAAYWGSRINATYGEPLYAPGPVGLDFPPGLERSA